MKWKFLSAFFFAVFLFVQVQAQGNNRGNAYYEEMIGNLSNQLRLLQDENAKLSGTVHSLQQELRELRQQLQALREEVGQLRRMITDETAARQKQLGEIADKLQRAAEAQNRPQVKPEPPKVTPGGNLPPAQEEFDYYVVEAGATLSAVSRATGVSVARLKQVNGLKSDVIRVGQKLKIPRK